MINHSSQDKTLPRRVYDGSVAKAPAQSNSSLGLLQDVIDASASNIAILDENRTIVCVNRAWRQFATRTGSLSDQFGIGLKYPDIGMGTAATSASDAAAIAKGIDRVIARKELEFQMEYQCTALADPAWFRVHAEGFLLGSEGRTSLVNVSHNDITSERLAIDSLIEDRENLQRLWGTTNILPWEADAKNRVFTAVGDQAEPMLGYPAKMWYQPDFWIDHLHAQDREKTIAECAKRLQTEDRYQFEYRMIAKDGRIVWINDIVHVHRDNGRPARLSGFMVDITERKYAENTLRLLGGRLIAAQEEERKRIARDLHDDLNQRMALLSIGLEQVGQMLGGDNTDGLADRVNGLQKKALSISTEIHRMSYNLHPSKLEHLGLVPALNSFCYELSQSRGIEIEFSHKNVPSNLPPDTTLCIFRIAQEGLQNAAKHSGVSHFDIRLEGSEKSIELTISDEGCGFELNSKQMTKGLGFIGIKERLRLVGGDMNIESGPGRGTRIVVSVPVNDPIPEPAGLGIK